MRLQQTLFILFAAYMLWFALIIIEIVTGYVGAWIQLAYAASLLGLFFLLWLTNRNSFQLLHRPVLEFILVGSLTTALVLIFYIFSLWSYYYLALWFK